MNLKTCRPERRSSALAALIACAVVLALSGCAVVSVAGAAAGAAISVTGAVVSAGIGVTGAVIEAGVDAVSDDKDEDKDKNLTP